MFISNRSGVFCWLTNALTGAPGVGPKAGANAFVGATGAGLNAPGIAAGAAPIADGAAAAGVSALPSYNFGYIFFNTSLYLSCSSKRIKPSMPIFWRSGLRDALSIFR